MSGTNNPYGRPKGSLNKKNKDLQDLAQKHGVDPFEILLLIAKGDSRGLGYKGEDTFTEEGEEVNVDIPLDIRMDAAKDLMPYLYSKRKPKELEDDDSKGSNIVRLSYKVDDPLLEGPEDE